MKNKLIARKVKELIAENKTEEAIAHLAQSQLDEFDKEIILLNNRFNDISGEERLGVISYIEANIEYNKVNAALIDLVKKLEKGSDNVFSNEITEKKESSPNRSKKILLSLGILFLGALAGIFFYAEGNKTEGDFIICESAYEKKSEAQKRVAKLGERGYNGNAGFIWIPDYDCLTGKELYQVYIGPFNDKEKLKYEICRYNSKYQKNTYAVKLCKEGNREIIRCD